MLVFGAHVSVRATLCCDLAVFPLLSAAEDRRLIAMNKATFRMLGTAEDEALCLVVSSSGRRFGGSGKRKAVWCLKTAKGFNLPTGLLGVAVLAQTLGFLSLDN